MTVKKLLIALESMPVIPDFVPVVVQNPTITHTELRDSEEQSPETFDADIDDLIMVKSSLESYQVLLKATMLNGTLDRQTMLVVNRSLECFGLEPIINRFLSLENYENYTESQKNIASEDFLGKVGDKIKSTGKMIAEAFRKFIAWIKAFWHTWFTGLKDKIAEAEKLYNEVSRVKTLNDIEIVGCYNLAYNNVCALTDYPTAKEATRATYNVMNAVLDDYPFISKDYIEDIEYAIEQNKVESISDLPKEVMMKIQSEMIEQLKTTLGGKNDSDESVIVKNAIPGNKIFYLDINEYNGIVYPIYHYETIEGEPREKTLKITAANAKDIMHDVVSLLNSTEKRRNTLKFIDHYQYNNKGDENMNVQVYMKTIRCLLGSATKSVSMVIEFTDTIMKNLKMAIGDKK